MKLPRSLVAKTSGPISAMDPSLNLDGNRSVISWRRREIRFPISRTACSRPENMASLSAHSAIESGLPSGALEKGSSDKLLTWEEDVEKVIYGCRFMTFLGVWGSLVGSVLCFLKGCTYVVSAFQEYFAGGGPGGKIILILVEAIDIYLIGTVMLVFGMGLYELFISNLNIESYQQSHLQETSSYGSNLFGLFRLLVCGLGEALAQVQRFFLLRPRKARPKFDAHGSGPVHNLKGQLDLLITTAANSVCVLQERPKWLEIQSIAQLKTKLGHVIVTVLLIGLFEKSKKVVISSTVDLLCFSVTVLLASSCLYLLSKLNEHE
ncbi:uncharacterized protein LOC131247855 isoform X1 [Magnolia sinica]|uniref:uncharacterized protein LOC131247855 isoform X1 n=1 Tax=Magnolia sinica TaxID=86752 RepID=UPI002657F04B|nr:uncharacterized protein LOC131247855 isoform X1 [Magnolia sinica]